MNFHEYHQLVFFNDLTRTYFQFVRCGGQEVSSKCQSNGIREMVFIRVSSSLAILFIASSDMRCW